MGNRTPIISMLLAGFVVSALLAAIMAFLMSISERLSLNLHSVYSFLMGHVSVSSWSQIAVIAPLVIGGITLIITNMPWLSFSLASSRETDSWSE